jgi:hypothetical protein
MSDPEVREEDQPSRPRKLDRKSLIVAIAFGVALVLLVVLNMN